MTIESRVPESTLAQLTKLGHMLTVTRPYTQTMGRGQAVMRNSRTGTNYAASDPRGDGAAIPEPIVR